MLLNHNHDEWKRKQNKNSNSTKLKLKTKIKIKTSGYKAMSEPWAQCKSVDQSITKQCGVCPLKGQHRLGSSLCLWIILKQYVIWLIKHSTQSPMTCAIVPVHKQLERYLRLLLHSRSVSSSLAFMLQQNPLTSVCMYF